MKRRVGKATLLPSVRSIHSASPSFLLDELFVRPREQLVDPAGPFVHDAFLLETNGNSALVEATRPRNRYAILSRR